MKNEKTRISDYTVITEADRLYGRLLADVSLNPLDYDVSSRLFQIAGYGTLTGDTAIQPCRIENGLVIRAETEEATEAWGVYALVQDNEQPKQGVLAFHVEDVTTESEAKALAEAVGQFIGELIQAGHLCSYASNTHS